MLSIDWRLPLYGLVVGLLMGTTGMGGGAVMTPLLILGVGLPSTLAIGTDLVYATATKLVGTAQHWRQATIDRRVVRDLATGSLPSALVAVVVLAWFHSRDAQTTERWLQWIIGIALLLAAGLLVRRLVLVRTPSVSLTAPYLRRRVILIGAVGEFLVGLTSIGSGSLILALLVLLSVPLASEQLVGTDLAHATLLVGVTALAHLTLGRVDLAVAGQLLLGSIPGVLIGSYLTPRIPRRALQFGLATLLVLSALPLFR